MNEHIENAADAAKVALQHQHPAKFDKDGKKLPEVTVHVQDHTKIGEAGAPLANVTKH